MTHPVPADLVQAMANASDRLGLFAGRLSYFPSVSSTNDVALRLADGGAENGTTVLAATQTAGRGRQGKAWFSAPEAGLYFSSVIRGVKPTMVTLMAGVAVGEGVRTATSLAVELKWPNDVVLPAHVRKGTHRQTAKLAGILTETSRVGQTAEAIIVGIGINVGRTDYPSALASRASSLEAELGAPVDRAAILVEVLSALARWREVLAAGGTNRVLTRWRELAPTSEGAAVAWSHHGHRQQGTTDGVDPDGALLVRCGDQVERVVAGELTWLT